MRERLHVRLLRLLHALRVAVQDAEALFIPGARGSSIIAAVRLASDDISKTVTT